MSEEENKGNIIPGESNPQRDRAASNGWQPLEDWVASGRDEADWADYPEFNVRGELMGKIQGMGRKLSSLEQENERLKKGVTQAAKLTQDIVNAQYEKAMRDLKSQRRDAMEAGDYDAVDDLDDRREELAAKRKELDAEREEDAPKQPEQKELSQLHPIERTFIDVINSTPGLAEDQDKVQQLGRYADQLWGSNPEISVTEFVRKLDQHMNPPRESAPSPSGNRGSTRPRSNGSQFTKNDLTEMELEFAKTFVETEAYDSIQAYIDAAAKNGALEIQQR